MIIYNIDITSRYFITGVVDIFIGSLWLFYWNSLSSATSSSLSRSWAKAALERLTS